jgi:acetoin utilization deacetylase AcuC-like enzyme
MFVKHDAGRGHPERPERLVAIKAYLEKHKLWPRLKQMPIREASRTELERNHSAEHIDRVLASSGKQRTYFDGGDTQASPHTAQAALLAAGGTVELARAVVKGEIERGFALVRPPGHHAEYHRAMGFCYFNNIAIAAHSMLEEEGLQRILIVDWDVHHGNGTQHSFERDPRVFFLSTHQYPYFPGSGATDEIGAGDGKGYSANIPLPPGQNDHNYRYCFKHILRPIAHNFAPQLIMISAGYDAHQADMLGSMRVSTEGFAQLTADVCELANELCDGKVVAVLEGGYDTTALSESVATSLRVMLGEKPDMSGDSEQAGATVRYICNEVKELLSAHWSFGTS